MKSKILGEIESHELDPDLYFGQPIGVPYFDNKKINVAIAAANHEETLIESDKVLAKFMSLKATDRNNNSKTIIEYYESCVKFGICDKIEMNKDNEIWEYVNPTEIIVDSEMDFGFYVTVSCECKWEPEHGLQLEFRNGTELVRAGGHE